MADNDICPKCERAVQGKFRFCKICRNAIVGGNDNDGPPGATKAEAGEDGESVDGSVTVNTDLTPASPQTPAQA